MPKGDKTKMLKIQDFIRDENFIFEKDFHHFSICARKQFSSEMQKLLQDPDYFLGNTSGPFFKSDKGDTTTIGVVDIDGIKVVVKRYNIKGWRHFIKKCWSKSRAFHSWQSAFYLKKNQIDTIEPIAIVEKRFGFLRGKSYFISQYVEAIRGCDYFGAQAMPNPEWSLIIDKIISIIKKLYHAHIRHHDFQYGNMLIANDKVLLLDLDHMKIYRKNNWFFRRAFRKDITHFFAFLESNSQAKKMFQEAFESSSKYEV